VDVGVELEQPGWVEGTDRATGDCGVALLVRVLPGEHHPPAQLEVELGQRQPGRDLVGLGERSPDALDRMSEPALEADQLPAVAALEGPVGHDFSCSSRWSSRASSRRPQSWR
jgi:hypothetical protein